MRIALGNRGKRLGAYCPAAQRWVRPCKPGLPPRGVLLAARWGGRQDGGVGSARKAEGVSAADKVGGSGVFGCASARRSLSVATGA